MEISQHKTYVFTTRWNQNLLNIKIEVMELDFSSMYRIISYFVVVYFWQEFICLT